MILVQRDNIISWNVTKLFAKYSAAKTYTYNSSTFLHDFLIFKNFFLHESPRIFPFKVSEYSQSTDQTPLNFS